MAGARDDYVVRSGLLQARDSGKDSLIGGVTGITVADRLFVADLDESEPSLEGSVERLARCIDRDIHAVAPQSRPSISEMCRPAPPTTLCP